jgi:acetylornithine deacetylase/succinyl-diaminopimelate desuccinylase-like protein
MYFIYPADFMESVEILRKLVGIPSIFPNEERIAVFIEQFLKKLGYRTKRQYVEKNRFNVLGEFGNGPTSIFFYGHLDTVEVCKGWKTNPFELKVEKDIAYGLGAYDMKGGITAILRTLEIFKPKNLKIKVAFGVDEENISRGADVLVRSGWLKDVNYAIVPEAATTYESLGPKMIILGRRGRVAVRVIVRGKSAHGAQPDLGINAIEEGSKIILALKKLKLRSHKLLGKSTVCPLKFESKVESLSVPEIAEIVIDRHLVPPETQSSVLREMKTLVKNLHLRAKVDVKFVKRDTPFLMPYITPKEHPFVKMVSNIVKKKFGKVVFGYGLSVADENYFGSRAKLPVIVIGPKGGNCHTSNEWVSISSINELIEIFREVLETLDSNRNI